MREKLGEDPNILKSRVSLYNKIIWRTKTLSSLTLGFTYTQPPMTRRETLFILVVESVATLVSLHSAGF
jgi:hypothetical protein